MNEKLTQVEKWINEAQLTRAESEALEENLGFLQDENARLREALQAAHKILQECMKESEE